MADNFVDIVELIVRFSSCKLEAVKTLRGVSRVWAAVLTMPKYGDDHEGSTPAAVLAYLQNITGANDYVTARCLDVSITIKKTSDFLFAPSNDSWYNSMAMLIGDGSEAVVTYDIAAASVHSARLLFSRTAPFYTEIYKQTNGVLDSMMTGAVVADITIDGATLEIKRNKLKLRLGGETHEFIGVACILEKMPPMDQIYTVRGAHYWVTTSKTAALWLGARMTSRVFAHIWAI